MLHNAVAPRGTSQAEAMQKGAQWLVSRKGAADAVDAKEGAGRQGRGFKVPSRATPLPGLRAKLPSLLHAPS